LRSLHYQALACRQLPPFLLSAHRVAPCRIFGITAFIAVMLMYSTIIFGEGQRFVNPMDVLFR